MESDVTSPAATRLQIIVSRATVLVSYLSHRTTTGYCDGDANKKVTAVVGRNFSIVLNTNNSNKQTAGRTVWLDLSYPWDLLRANESMLAELEPDNLGTVEANVVLKGAVAIGKDTVIKSGVYIEGPVIIGEKCSIGPNCYIRAHTSVGDNCHIGNAVEVKNSIILNGSKIPHQNYIGDSVIGEHCNFGAGTKIANLRLDKKDIIVTGINTGRRKLGAIVGDRVETGVNACINVGSLIGNNTYKDTTITWNCFVLNTFGTSMWGTNATFSGWDLGSYANTTLNSNNISLKPNGIGQYENTTGYYESKIYSPT